MSPLRNPLVAVAFLLAGAAGAHASDGQALVGHFTAIDRNLPGCGFLFLGSSSTFVADGHNGEISLVVPCVEMATAKNTQSGEPTPLELHKRYRIVVSHDRPKNLTTPAASPGMLYFVEAQVAESQRPGHPPRQR